MAFGDLDSHDAQVEQPVHERARHLRVIVHFADKRLNFPAGELEHTVAKERFVLAEAGQRRMSFNGLFHGVRMLSFEGHE